VLAPHGSTDPTERPQQGASDDTTGPVLCTLEEPASGDPVFQQPSDRDLGRFHN